MAQSGQSVDVAIIGAGPAGLTAAYLLAKAGYSVTVIEKDPVHVGGIRRTVEHRGFRFDIGGHRLCSKSKEVVDLWNEILPGGVIERPRMSRLYYESKFYSDPLRMFEVLRNLGLPRSATCLASYAKARLFPNPSPKSFQDWAINQVGAMLFSIFLKTHTEKVSGMRCDAISADEAERQVEGLGLGGAVPDGIRRWLRHDKRPKDGAAAKAPPESFHYPRKGPRMMWEAARDFVLAGGNKVLMGHALKQLNLERRSDRWRVAATDAMGHTVMINARHVIASSPLRELAGRIHPLPATAGGALDLRYRDVLTVVLMIRAKDPFPDDCISIHDPKVRVGGIRNFRSSSSETIGDPAVSCAGLEYFGFEGDGLWSLADADLVALAKREMALLGLCDPRLVEGGVVVREEKAYPVCEDQHRASVAALRGELEAAYPTLHLVGGDGMHRPADQDQAMATAMLSVRNIIAGQRIDDAWAVNDPAEHDGSGRTGDAAGRAAAATSDRVPRRIAA